MDPVLAKYATSTVPRYTSYPTVPHFTNEFPAAQYRDWLGAIDPKDPVSLYLHVPFCRQLCWYCGCNMKLATRYEPISSYVESLLEEIELVHAALPGRLTLSHLHWGGGTPTSLEPDDLERIMCDLARRFEFTADAEIAIECDPRTLAPEMVERIGIMGFTRASFGVQEFAPEVQSAINRIQPPEMVRDAVESLRDVGVQGINFDLIYGLPYQTVSSLEDTVAKCLEIGPDRIALFGYAHVPWMAKKQRMIAESALPGTMERAAQAAAAAAALTQAGYVAIGIDHFARKGDPLAVAARNGTLHRNFQGYTTDTATTLIGLGATSIGRTPEGYVQNIAETGAWARAVAAGELPIAKGHALTGEDRLRAHVIERVMCDGVVDLRAAAEQFSSNESTFADVDDELSVMAADGLLNFEDGVVRLSEAGLPLARVVAGAFDSYRRQSSTRHSIAI